MRKKKLILICLMLFAWGWNAIPAKGKVENDKVKICGPYSLFMVCEMLSVKADLEQIVKLTGTKDKGTTMKELANAAYKLGLKARGMKVPLKQLKKMKTPFIAHVKGNRFLVVEKVIEEQVRLIDYGREPYLMPISEFVKIWKGYVLTVSAPKNPKNPQPDIYADHLVYDFGVVQQYTPVRHTFIIKNLGARPLVLEAKPSCNCTSAVLSTKTVAPDDQARLKVLFYASNLVGQEFVTVTIHSNDPDEPSVLLTMKGIIIIPEIPVIPQVIELGDINGKEEMLKVVEVYDKGEKRLVVKKIKSSSDKVKAKIIGQEKGKKSVIQVLIKPGLPLGDFREQVVIYTNDSKNPKLIVPIRGNVVGPITTFPKQLFFGFVQKGKKFSQSIILHKRGELGLKITQVEVKLDDLSTEVISVKDGLEYEVKITFIPSDKTSGMVKDAVYIHTNQPQQPSIRVPLYAIVQ